MTLQVAAESAPIPPGHAVGGRPGRLQLDEYRSALDDISGESLAYPPARLLRVLVARDAIAAQLADPSRASTASDLIALAELDRQLKARAISINAGLANGTLETWRDTRGPPTAAWWWSLDQRAASAQATGATHWTILTALFVLISLSLTAEIARRFLSVGPDLIGVLSTIAQGVLAILAGSTLTEAGRRNVERFVEWMGVKRAFLPRWKAALALVVLGAVLVLRLSLPAVAHRYVEIGVGLHSTGQITSEIEEYQRAISLDPDSLEAHYNLGSALEDVLDYDRAMSEYQRALIGDAGFLPATNNLAHLYIARRNDFASALALLDGALGSAQMARSDAGAAAIRYSMYKNRAWAYLGLKQPDLAQADLKQALTLRPDGAAAHCLMAQLLEARSPANPTVGVPEWEACIRFKEGDTVEPLWIATARARLNPNRQ